MNVIPNSIEGRDARFHMHPYTNARDLQEKGALIMERGDGIHVYDGTGKEYIEAMAGLWCTALGFSEQRLVDAAIKQMQQLPYYHTFSGRGHGPAGELAEKLVGMAPVPMSKAFFTNSGSEANDTIVKMLWYRANAMGQPERKKIISRLRGYHGITTVAASMTGLPMNHNSFSLPLPGFLHTGSPHYWRDCQEGETEEAFVARRAAELEEMILAEGPETIAAFIGEPVLGAGGVVVPPKGYWQAIQAVLDKYEILLIADEVICGFGRTGKMFGTETFGMRPDIMTLSKQITSAYQPFSAILINDRVFEPIADESNRLGAFGHGFTGGGHPVGAAVALENLRIIEEEGLVEHAAKVGAYMQAGLAKLTSHPLVGEHRGVGLIAGLELVTDKAAKKALDKPGALGAAASTNLLELGVVSRAMGDTLGFCPPLIITEAQVDTLLGRVATALDQTQKQLGL
ncbi:aspartate aminotransferase family protein [Chachezhania sediminis]|uniref:aspartate aminotransferase family protein n=1 Tax=Chachezhania sediminis TaxID=2599291 RepID=UPI00131BC7F9|nr:aspartate aminotransferase family protein [Chachezhania sediminis]